jgi:hypothetical protein
MVVRWGRDIYGVGDVLPETRGPLKVPPMIGIATRIWPVGGELILKLSPKSHAIVYSNVMVGGTTGLVAFCAFADARTVADIESACTKRMAT